MQKQDEPPSLGRGVSVVVPVFNGERTLAELITGLENTFAGLNLPFEIILVDDGSGDGSWERIRNLAGTRQRLRGIRLMRNYGQHNALLCGVRAARHDVIVTMDDDLQHSPEHIPRLLAELACGHDVVYATPERHRHGFWRDLASRLNMLLLRWATGNQIAHVSAFRAFRTHLRAAFDHYESPFVSLDVLLTWGTTRFCSIPVPYQPRRHGESNYTWVRLVYHALNMLTSYSTVPLRLSSALGFLISLIGAVVLFYVVGRYLLQGSTVPGFPFLASIIAIFSGAQLFSLGIIGEYLARIHSRSMGRPVSVVRESVGFGLSGEGSHEE